MTTGNGSAASLTVLQQIGAGVAGITEADILTPERQPKPGDTIVGSAPFHVKALFSFAQRLANVAKEEARPFTEAAKKARHAAMLAGVTTNEGFDAFLAEHPEMKAATDKVEELEKKHAPLAPVVAASETLLHAELALAFPEVDQEKSLELDSDWNVVYRKRPKNLLEMLEAAMAGDGGDVQVMPL